MGVDAGVAQRQRRGSGRRVRDTLPPGPAPHQMTPAFLEPQFLIIDADDTLWENNIYFERAFADFVEFLAHSSLSPAEVRDVLDEIELTNAKLHGYGSLKFGKNLSECYRHLAEREIRDQDLRTVIGFAERILEC